MIDGAWSGGHLGALSANTTDLGHITYKRHPVYPPRYNQRHNITVMGYITQHLPLLSLYLLFPYSGRMTGLTVAEMAEELGLPKETVKSRLKHAHIHPIAYAGRTGMYALDAIEKIRSVPPPGRPKQAR